MHESTGLMPRRPIVLPSTRAMVPGIARGRKYKGAKRAAGPVRVTVHHPGTAIPLSILQFDRKYPRACWMVPQVVVPLYWFDTMMLKKKKLLTVISQDLFVVDGRRFRVLMQDYKVIGRGITRWLCYEERDDLPNKGRP